MTTDHQMAMMYATAQQQVIAALCGIGEPDLADRLERCMTARRERRGGDGWPFTCRSAACVWCRPTDDPFMVEWHVPMVGRSNTSSLAIIPTALVGWPARRCTTAAAWVARRSRPDGAAQEAMARVCFAGMAGGDGMALVMVTHEGVDRREVEDVLRRRWPDVVVKESGAGGAGRGDVGRRCCRSRTVPPRCRAAADRGHAPARSADRRASHRADAGSCLRRCRPDDGVRRHHDHPDRLTTLTWPGWSGWSHRSDLFTNPPR